jgi:hypothetical protein
MNESLKKVAEKLEKQNGNISIRSIKPYTSSISRPFTTIVVDKKHFETEKVSQPRPMTARMTMTIRMSVKSRMSYL